MLFLDPKVLDLGRFEDSMAESPAEKNTEVSPSSTTERMKGWTIKSRSTKRPAISAKSTREVLEEMR